MNPTDALSKAFSGFINGKAQEQVDTNRTSQVKQAIAKATQANSSQAQNTNSLANLNPDKPDVLRMLGRQIKQGLQQFLPTLKPSSARGAYANLLKPEDSIKQDVATAFYSNPELSSPGSDLFSKFQDSIQDSISQTKDLLDKMGQLNEKIETEISSAAQNISQDINAGLATAASEPVRGLPLVSGSAYQEYSRSTAASAEIVIETKEGDRISLSFSQSSSYSNSKSLSFDQDSLSVGEETSFSTEAGFSVLVEGDINKDEAKSIEKLMNRVNKIADKFFDGDVQKALQQAEKLKIDPSTLSSISVDLSSSVQTKQVEAYQLVSQFPSSAKANTTNAGPNTLSPIDVPKAASVVADLENLLNAEEIISQFKNASETLTQLFSQSALEQGLTEKSDDPVFDQFKELLKSLLAKVEKDEIEHESDDDHDEDKAKKSEE